MQKLRITNLPRWISEIHLKQFFNNCGKIVHASVALDEATLRPLGYGYLVFDSEDACERALAKSGDLLDGSIITVALDAELPEETNSTLPV